jgi:predicted nucleic acid-binding protein
MVIKIDKTATTEGLKNSLERIRKNRAIRQNNKIKLPDAIIAATAMQYGLPLVTADKGFSKITNLDLLLINL